MMMLNYIVISAVVTVVIGGLPNRHSSSSRLEEKIVGGHNADIEELPYQLSLERYGRIACGATLISSNVALTAAHCTNGHPASIMRVRGGSSFMEEEGQVVNVESVRQHPNFDSSNNDNDVSVLILTQAFLLGPQVQPKALVDDHHKVSPGTLCIVSGWGVLEEGGPLFKQLQVIELPVISRKDCVGAYQELEPLGIVVTESMLCAGYEDGGKDACQGDSGGPMVCNGLLAGIISWGIGCNRPEFPSVYADVSQLREFIKNASGV